MTTWEQMDPISYAPMMEALKKRELKLNRLLTPEAVADTRNILCLDHDGYVYDGTDLIGNCNHGLRAYSNKVAGTICTCIVGVNKHNIHEVDALSRLSLLACAFRDTVDDYAVTAAVSEALRNSNDAIAKNLKEIYSEMDSIVRAQRGCIIDQKPRKWDEMVCKASILTYKSIGEGKDRKKISTGTVDEEITIKLPPSGLYSHDYLKGYAVGYFDAKDKKVAHTEFSIRGAV